MKYLRLSCWIFGLALLLSIPIFGQQIRIPGLGTPGQYQAAGVKDTGSGRVGDDGAFHYRYPMGSVDLSYNSDHGWSWSVGSVISRGTRKGVPSYDNSKDTFLLDGQELVWLETEGSVARYATKQVFDENPLIILFHTDTDTWQIYHPDGSQAFYTYQMKGNLGHSTGKTYAWGLNLEYSRGLYEETHYVWSDFGQGQHEVTYIVGKKSGNGNGRDLTQLSYRKLEQYLQINYRSGSRIRTTYYLSNVTQWRESRQGGTWIQPNALFEPGFYKTLMSFEITPDLGFTDHWRVQEIAAVMGGERQKPVKFFYDDQPPNPEFQGATFSQEYSLTGLENAYYPIAYEKYGVSQVSANFEDFNNDGLLDRLVQGNSNVLQIWLNKGGGTDPNALTFSQAPSQTSDGSFILASGSHATYLNMDFSDILDLNGDGYPDRLRWYSGEGQIRVYLNQNGVLQSAPVVYWPMQDTNPLRLYGSSLNTGKVALDLIDMNGDGRVDRVLKDAYSGGVFSVQLNNGQAFDSIRTWQLLNGKPIDSSYLRDGLFYSPDSNGNFSVCTKTSLADMNADGLPDRVTHFFDDSGKVFLRIYFNQGTGFDPQYQDWRVSVKIRGLTYTNNVGKTGVQTWSDLFDYNGDGLPDLVQKNYNNSTNTNWEVYLNTGHGFRGAALVIPGTDALSIHYEITPSTYDPKTGVTTYYAPQITHTMLDLNGDGYPDRVYGLNPKKYRANLWNPAFERLWKIADLKTGQKTVVNYQVLSKKDNPQYKPAKTVVSRIWMGDGSKDPLSYKLISHFFREGVYDMTEREFRGFGVVESRDENSVRQVRYFHTDVWKEGLLKSSATYNYQGKLLERVTHDYEEHFPSNLAWTKVTILQKTRDLRLTYDETGQAHYQTDDYWNYYGTMGGVDLIKGTEVTHWGETDATGKALGNERSLTSITYENRLNLGSGEYVTGLVRENKLCGPGSAGGYELRSGTRNDYDGFGNLQCTWQWNGNNWINPLTYEYDQWGNVYHIYNVYGHNTYFEYDDFFRSYPRFKYDHYGMTTSYGYDDLMRLCHEIDPNNVDIGTEYDIWNRVIRKTLNNAVRMTYEYRQAELDSLLNLGKPAAVLEYSALVDDTGVQAAYYDGFGRVIQVKQKVEGGYQTVNHKYGVQSGSPNRNVHTQYASYLSGTLDYTGLSDMPGNTLKSVTTAWNEQTGAVIEVVDTAGYKTRSRATPWSKIVTDAKGNVCQEKLDGFGRLIRLTEPPDQNNVKPVTTYTYKGGTDLLINVRDTYNRDLSFDYDFRGHKILMKDPQATGDTRYEYDELGRLWKETHSNNTRTEFYYDALNRLTQKIGYQGDQWQIYYTLSYDDATHNGLGLLTQIEGFQADAADNPYKILQEDLFYNNQSKLSRHEKNIYGESAYLTYEYSPGGYLTEMRTSQNDVRTYRYDPAGRVKELNVGGTPLVDQVQYNPQGLLESYRTANNETFNLQYDTALRLSRLGTASNLLELNYGYDGLDNVISLAQNYTNPFSQSLVYDNLNRLVTAVTPNGQKDYQYYRNGDIQSKDNRAYKYDSSRVHLVTDDTRFTYQYDPMGNLTTKSTKNSGQAWTYTYDGLNQLAAIKQSDLGDIYGAFYDADGQRILSYSKKAAAKITMTYQFFPELEETWDWDATGNFTKEWTHYYFFNGRIAQRTEDNWKFHYKDLLGSTVLLTDQNRARLWNGRYEPFGGLSGSGEFPTHVFNDKPGVDTLAGTGLYYYGARYYDWDLGRFITPDSVISLDSQGLNRYAYCQNNPTSRIDPSGNYPTDPDPSHPYWKGKEQGIRNDSKDCGAAGLVKTPPAYPGLRPTDFTWNRRSNKFIRKPSVGSVIKAGLNVGRMAISALAAVLLNPVTLGNGTMTDGHAWVEPGVLALTNGNPKYQDLRKGPLLYLYDPKKNQQLDTLYFTTIGEYEQILKLGIPDDYLPYSVYNNLAAAEAIYHKSLIDYINLEKEINGRIVPWYLERGIIASIVLKNSIGIQVPGSNGLLIQISRENWIFNSGIDSTLSYMITNSLKWNDELTPPPLEE